MSGRSPEGRQFLSQYGVEKLAKLRESTMQTLAERRAEHRHDVTRNARTSNNVRDIAKELAELKPTLGRALSRIKAHVTGRLTEEWERRKIAGHPAEKMAKAGTPMSAVMVEVVDEILGYAVVDEDFSGLIDALVASLGKQFSLSAAQLYIALQLPMSDAGMDDALDDVNDEAESWAREHAAELVKNISESTREMIRSDVDMAIIAGDSAGDLASTVAENYAFSDARAETIGRTELALANVAGHVQVGHDTGAVGKMLLLGSEHDTAESSPDECDDAADLGVIGLDDDFNGNGDPPIHPNACFAGTTFVPYGEALQIIRSLYDGPAILIEARLGEFSAWAPGTVIPERIELTIGPHHPVLTRRGFVEAALLREGDELLYDARVQAQTNHANFKNVPFFEDAFEAANAVSPGKSSVASAARYFHGDEESIYGEVDVVRPARRLLPVLDPLGIQQLRKCSLMGADMEAAHVARCSACRTALERVFASASGSVSGGGHGQASSGVLSRPPPFQCFRIIATHRTRFNGVAFDASTSSGFYLNSGLVVRNCVCDIKLIYPDDPEADDLQSS